MKTFIRVLAAAGMLVAAGAVAQAQCISKPARHRRRRRFAREVPAWEAVLQGTPGACGALDGVEQRAAWRLLQGQQREIAL